MVAASIDMYGQTGMVMAFFFTEIDLLFSGSMHIDYFYVTEIIILASCELLYMNFVKFERSLNNKKI